MAALHCTKERKKKQSHFFSNHKERAVVRSENQEGHLVLDEYNMPSHLVEIGLTYLPKTGGGHMPPGPPFVTGLLFTSRTKMHSGAKIQNSYKILSIDTYYKGKLAFQERLLSCKKYIHDILYIL